MTPAEARRRRAAERKADRLAPHFQALKAAVAAVPDRPTFIFRKERFTLENNICH